MVTQMDQRILKAAPLLDLDESMPGRLIEHHRVGRKLGEGGMAVVFEALHERLNRRAAIKFLRPELGRTYKELWARFFNEARAANQIAHPGIITIYQDGVLKPEKIAFILMEYIDGESVWDRLNRIGGGPVWLPVIQQTASAMAAVHAQDILHRDLKPQNLMLIKDPDVEGGNRVKVVDFGLAKLPRQHLVDGEDFKVDGDDRMTVFDSDVPSHIPVVDRDLHKSILGTPLYMSPEQCRGSRLIGTKSDVYSLGSISYRLLSGRPMFSGHEFIDLIPKHLQERPVPLTELLPSLPRSIAELVARMLAKHPNDRPTMDEVAEVLKIEAARAHAGHEVAGLLPRPPSPAPMVAAPRVAPAPIHVKPTEIKDTRHPLVLGGQRAVARRSRTPLLILLAVLGVLMLELLVFIAALAARR